MKKKDLILLWLMGKKFSFLSNLTIFASENHSLALEFSSEQGVTLGKLNITSDYAKSLAYKTAPVTSKLVYVLW